MKSSPYLRSCSILVALLLLLVFTPRGNLFAQTIGQIDKFRPVLVVDVCLLEIFEIEIEVPIVVGCEIIDCCPGCPGPDFLEWRIRYGGTPVNSVALQFDGLNAEAARRLKISGNAKWRKKSQLVIGKGETVIRGFRTDRKSRPAVAYPRIEISKAEIKRLLRSAPKKSQDKDIEYVGQLTFVLEQRLGPVVVNEYAFSYRVKYCFPPRLSFDRIDLDNNTNNDNAVVFLDGRTRVTIGGIRRFELCMNDRIFRGNDVITLPNMLPNTSFCTSEAAVFSDNDAMQFVSPVKVWTTSTGDVLQVDQTPDLLGAPATLWIAADDNPATAVNETVTRATTDTAQLTALFNTNHVGAIINANLQNVSANAAAVAAIGTPTCTAANITALQGSGFYTLNQINIYYIPVAAPLGARAYNCIADRNIIVVGQIAQPDSLAHEVGHSFSLGHTNTAAGISVDYNVDGNPDFANTNLMWTGGVGRTTLSEAQAFRMNLNPTSTLVTNGTRTGTTRACADSTVSRQCPWLGLDAVPN